MDWLQNQTRLFRALLRCYPAEFRHEYGSEMEQLFADRLQAEPRLRLWLETIADLALGAPREHGNILASDLRYGIRVLAASPGFTVVALLTIALGIGATTAIFSLVNAVLLRSLPFGHPDKLVYLWSPNPRLVGVPQEMGPNVPDFYAWQHLSRSFSAMTMLRETAVNVVRNGSANRVEAALVTGSFFRTLQASPELGRSIDAHDDQLGNKHVAVISDRLWHSQFGAAPEVLGKQIQLNREQYTVIGVMPKDFGYPSNGDIPYGQPEWKQTDLWLPAAYTVTQKTNRTDFESADAVIGRLRDGVSPAAAQEELKTIETRLGPLYPEMWKGWTALVRPLVQTIIGPVEKMLWLLLGAVIMVLLIAVSNVANLLFARAATRAHEIGIRTALGAERARIIRQLLTESLLLSGMGGAGSIILAYASVYLLIRLNPGNIPRFDTAAIDGRALLVALALSLAAGLISGLAPTVSASRSSINHLLKRGGIRGVAGSSNRGRFALIVVEVALSVILLAGAGLLIRSYLQLETVDPGFSPATLTFRLTLDERYNTPRLRSAFYKNFLAKLGRIRGVAYVGSSNETPLNGQESVAFVNIRGSGRSKQVVENRSVTPGYRKALGTPLLLGRDFNSHDVNSNAAVMIVNRRFVEEYFHGRDPLRQQLRIGIGNLSGTPWSTVIGVVGNVRHNKLEEEGQPQLFQPVDSGDNFAMRGSGAIPPVVTQVRAALRSLDPTLTLEGLGTMGERMSQSNARRRFQTVLLTGFGAIAIALSLVGLYGLMSYTVKERMAEIGVRLALGSSRSRIVSLILWQGLRLTAAGLIIGLTGAFALTRLVSGWLFGVKATDPVTFLAVPLLMLLVACCACLIPAWSAMKTDPVQALRQE